MNFNQIVQSFQAEMRSKGITPPQYLTANGKIHRFYIEGDRRGTKNGWYILYMDGLPGGAFGSWKLGIALTWCLKKRQFMSNHEFAKLKRQMDDARHQRDMERDVERKKAAILAKQRWCSYPVVDPNHPYLVRKQISPFCARQCSKEIVLPIIDFFGEFHSLQYIHEDGSKRFLPNGAIKSHFIPVHKHPKKVVQILVCEGLATAATLAQAYPDSCVIAACNSGNLKSVALVLRENLPETKIIICADDDRQSLVNTGLNKAYEAAIAARALFTKPEWPATAPQSLTDFNDLAIWLARGAA